MEEVARNGDDLINRVWQCLPQVVARDIKHKVAITQTVNYFIYCDSNITNKTKQ